MKGYIARKRTNMEKEKIWIAIRYFDRMKAKFELDAIIYI